MGFLMLLCVFALASAHYARASGAIAVRQEEDDDCGGAIQTESGTFCDGDAFTCGTTSDNRSMICSEGLCVIDDVVRHGVACDPSVPSGGPAQSSCHWSLECKPAYDGANRCVLVVGSGTFCGDRNGVPAVFIACPDDHRCEIIDNPVLPGFDRYCRTDLVAQIGEFCAFGGVGCVEGAQCRLGGGKSNTGRCIKIAASGEPCGSEIDTVCNEREVNGMSGFSCGADGRCP